LDDRGAACKGKDAASIGKAGEAATMSYQSAAGHGQ
jgi:hypothetical protein